MTEQESLCVLNAIPSLGAIRIRKLIQYFGSASKVFEQTTETLSHCPVLLPTIAENIFHFSKDKFLQDEYNLMRRKKVGFVTFMDEDYPCSLKDFEDAPVVLYVKGSPEVLSQQSLAIVGSRAAGYYGCQSARCFARAFAQAGFVVVSGLARGIDTAAHKGCLEAPGPTIAVIGCGFNYVYPKENEALMDIISQNGAVVSEFSFSMPPLKGNFPWRNRIISGLS
ncbi:MAG: DNA-processing protein DprA, partial [Candidatus Omnitrophica bacterium]|nr:DNA-processing protein DprA [Candidatus Omnitrophota bacterium]